MTLDASKVKKIFIVILVIGITLFHYFTRQANHYYHIFYQQLYFLPLILGAFWFGLRGALATSFTISLLYLPFILMHWVDFSPEDFNRLLAIVIYNLMAVAMGILRERESREQQRFREEQKRLRAAESLAAMGRAISSVAHDMKTPLIAIGGFSRLVQKHHQKDDPCYGKLDIVIKETQRLENMVKDMLDFSRPLELHRSIEDVNQLVNESLAVVSPAAEVKKVKLQFCSSPNLGPVSLDAMRMKQVLINLMVNAVQASPEGETVTIGSCRRGKEFVLEVSDCGGGISPDKREEIFQPFVTNKKDGTGLGLPIAKKIVEAHHGRIDILDDQEKGLAFRVSIPWNKTGSKS